jgi:hypothetical protein
MLLMMVAPGENRVKAQGTRHKAQGTRHKAQGNSCRAGMVDSFAFLLVTCAFIFQSPV